jgi:ribonuclease BN (tRNA processing enzyme)
MKLTFAGTAAAFHRIDGNFHSNMVVETQGGDGETRRLLIDCGSDARWSLDKLGLTPVDLDAIYVSHLHSDHIGGLEWVAFMSYFSPGCNRPRLYIVDELVEPLWEHSLRGGLELADKGDCTLETYFDVHPLKQSEPFEWEDLSFDIVVAPHIVTPDHSMMSYGLASRGDGETFFLTTDCRFEPEKMAPHYAAADVIFQDCETGPRMSGVHAHYTELVTLPAETKAKMWLYHYQTVELPDAQADGFRGFVKPGQSFTF